MLRASANIASSKLFAQLIVFILLPLVTRQYSAEIIGFAFSQIALASIVSSISSLGYHLSIPAVKKQIESDCLIILSVLIIAITTLLYVLVTATLLQLNDKGTVIALSLGCYVLFSSISALVIQSCIRIGRYRIFSIITLLSGPTSYVAALLFGKVVPSEFSILFGLAIGQMIGCFFAIRIIKTVKIGKRSLRRLFLVAKKNRNFPLLSAPTILLNSAGSNLPLILVGTVYSTTNAALFAIVERIILAPVTLIGASFGTVYVGEIAKANRENPVEVQRIFLSALKISITYSLLISITLFLLSHLIDRMFFPPEWLGGDLLIKTLSFLVFFRLVSTSVARVFTVLNRQELALYWNLLRVATVVLSFLLCGALDISFEVAMAIYVIISSLLDLTNIVMAYGVVKKRAIAS